MTAPVSLPTDEAAERLNAALSDDYGPMPDTADVTGDIRVGDLRLVLSALSNAQAVLREAGEVVTSCSSRLLPYRSGPLAEKIAGVLR